MHSEPISPHFDLSTLVGESNVFTPTPNLWNQFPYGLNHESEYRINEALKLNSKKLVGLSQQKKGGVSRNFFTKPQTQGRAGTIYRITYGDDTIPKASESDFRGTMTKSGPYIPAAYKNFQSHQLPTFLKEKLNEQNKTKRTPMTSQSSSSILPTLPDQPLMNKTLSHVKSGGALPSISPNTTKSLAFLSKDLLTKYSKVSSYESVRSPESSEFQYLSPKARKQMKSEPILMSSVFLTGQIHPEGVSPSYEPAVEHIITEHHSRAKIFEDMSLSKVVESQLIMNEKSPKKKLDKFSVAWSLAQQEKKKKEGEATLYNKEPKNNLDKVGMKLKATVGQLRMEREMKRKKVLNILKTKNFNLFRPNTINNLHLLKDAL